MGANGGITKGKSHAEGGIPMVVKSTGQHVELEGGEGVINKRNMASTKTYEFQGKKMTACEIASAINSADGNGVKIDCEDVVGTKYKYGTGGFIDLFEDYGNIPPHVQTILNDYQEALEDGDYKELENLRKDLEQVGYTFDFYVDGSPYGLRPKNIPINEVQGYEQYKNGGELKLGTKMEMEHADTINDFKKEGISTKEVATAIAKDHLKENPRYYTELKRMENERKNQGLSHDEAHKLFEEYDLIRSRNQNKRKYKYGGTLPVKEPVHVSLKESFRTTLYNMRTGEYSGNSLLRENQLHHLNLLEADAQSTTFNYPNTDYYFTVPTSIINIRGKSRTLKTGGIIDIQFDGYESDLTTNDRSILEVLRGVDNAKLTHKDKEFISSFRGDNLVNYLPNKVCEILYSLTFKHHATRFQIKEIVLLNIGTGNLLSLAPNYVKSIQVDFADNKYKPIEEQINAIQNPKKTKLFLGNYSNVDAVIHVYPHINPRKENLMQLLRKNPNGSIVCGLAEFSTKEKTEEFKNGILEYSNKEFNTYFYELHEGISSKGRSTLIYLANSY